MKKYSKSIEVKGENIKELFDCPVVTDIKKATEAVDDGLDVGDMLQHVIAMDYSGSHKQVKRGSVLAMDFCRHLDFNAGNAIKYLLRKDKVDGDKTKTEKRIEDLRKAIFYIEDEIKLLENGKENV